MTLSQILKENANLKAANDASKEAAKSLYTLESVYEHQVCAYWETVYNPDGTVKRAGFDKAAAIFGFDKPSQMMEYMSSGDIHPNLIEVGEDGKEYFVLHGEKYVEDETKWITDKKGNKVHPYKKDRKGVLITENCTKPIKRWGAEIWFELLTWDQYFKAKDAVEENLSNAKAIAESQGVSMESLVDNVAKQVVKKQQKTNEEQVAAAKTERKAARQAKK